MADALEKLKMIDPSDSMQDTLDAVSDVLDRVGSYDDNGATALQLIAQMEQKARNYYLRPLDSEEIYNRLIDIHQERNEDDIVARYRRCLDLREARKYTILGDSYALMGINTTASEYLEMALDHGPSEDLVEEVEKTLVRAKKRVAKASDEIDILLMKLDKDPTHQKNIIKTVTHLIDLDRFDEAIQRADVGLDVWKNDPDLNYRKGCALFGRGDMKEALVLFDVLLETKPTSNNYKRAVNLSHEMMK